MPLGACFFRLDKMSEKAIQSIQAMREAATHSLEIMRRVNGIEERICRLVEGMGEGFGGTKRASVSLEEKPALHLELAEVRVQKDFQRTGGYHEMDQSVSLKVIENKSGDSFLFLIGTERSGVTVELRDRIPTHYGFEPKYLDLFEVSLQRAEDTLQHPSS